MVEIPESAKHHFDHILPPGQDWFTPQELAKILGRSDQYIRNALEQGVILNHTFQIGKRRRHYQVPRSAVILYILETAERRSRKNIFVYTLQVNVECQTQSQFTIQNSASRCGCSTFNFF